MCGYGTEMPRKYKEGKGTRGGCLNYSAAINYLGISCGLTKINSFGPLIPSCCLQSLLFPRRPSIRD